MPLVLEQRTKALAWLVLCAASPLQAQPATDSPRVYIVSVPMEPGLEAYATRAGSAARAALRNIEGVNWRDPDQRFLGYDQGALTLLERARQRLDEGRRHYLNLELEQAITVLESAVADFDAAAAAMEDPGDLGQALLFLGASHAFNAQRRQAIVIFRRLHTQMPHIHPDNDTFPPEVTQLFEQSRANEAPSSQIEIASDPPGAIAYVDFLARGRTPITVSGLLSGEHVVRVTRPGAVPFVEEVQLRARGAASSSAYLADEQGAEGLADALEQVSQADVGSIRAASPITQIATILALAKIGVIRVSSASEGQVALELLLFDVHSGRRLVRGNGTVATDVGAFEDGVQRLVAGAFETALRAQVAEAAPPPPHEETPWEQHTPTPVEPPFFEQWWFWTIVGVSAAAIIALAIGIGFAASGPSLASDPNGQVILQF